MGWIARIVIAYFDVWVWKDTVFRWPVLGMVG